MRIVGTVYTNERTTIDKEACLMQNHWRVDLIRISMVVVIKLVAYNKIPSSQEER